jgi:hypothetical protein
MFASATRPNEPWIFVLESARNKSAQFLSVAGSDDGTYRLTYELLPEDELVITLERTNLIHPS